MSAPIKLFYWPIKVSESTDVAGVGGPEYLHGTFENLVLLFLDITL